MGEPQAAIRLDKWLWQARFTKSRGLAVKMIESGAVRVNAVRVVKPATTIRVGDGLTFVLADKVLVLRVLALGTRRGPAPEARLLYDDLAAERAASDPIPALEPVRQADT